MASGREREEESQALWQGYEMVTHDLALTLCEQLRLILEPTLATRLKGDYRTGKRLNMKKIIPYIASQFKKDKIWLRRTRPSKRQYQVLLAIDDSHSMAESHSVELAYESVALISRALNQLEVGEMSVVGFGEQVRLLQPFNGTWSSDTGPYLLRELTFKQTRTDVRQLLHTTNELLQAARYNSGAYDDDLWQLQLIISDGICDDHARLAEMVRAATERRIMTVFIVLDDKPMTQSITATNRVAYEMLDGKMTLKMTRYLDTFPFEYYVVLRQVELLPQVLADALRQYFSIVNGSN
jgi:midasin (ATPase involved in ribosome maturation)